VVAQARVADRDLDTVDALGDRLCPVHVDITSSLEVKSQSLFAHGYSSLQTG
jgi:hypothetical protein